MAVDAFLKLGDIKGEAQAEGHEEEIEVLSWSWGMTQLGTTHRGTGGGAGKVEVNDLSIVHYLDAASPNLVRACCTGKHIPEAILTLRKAGETPLDYLIIKLEDVIVTSVVPGGMSGTDEIQESFTLNFRKFTYT